MGNSCSADHGTIQAATNSTTTAAASDSPRATPSRDEPHYFLVGDLVLLTGLERTNMNGQIGQFCGTNSDTGRVEVSLVDRDAQVVSLKPCNIARKPVAVSDCVRLHDLLQAEMNGSEGRVASWDSSRGRWNIVLVNGRTVAALSSNIAPIMCPALVETKDVAVDNSVSIPLLSEVPSDALRTEAQPASGIDMALGDAFASKGISNKGHDIPVATAVSSQ